MLKNDSKDEVTDNLHEAKPLIDLFHQLYHYSATKTWNNTFWLGFQTLKCPLDMWIYQEIICEVKPEIIIETGTHLGGSALYMAMVCDYLNLGKVITIDIETKSPRPIHSRIQYLKGSSISNEIVEEVRKIKGEKQKILVILDSEHKKQHVLDELKIYSQFISSGSYIIVEDTNINGHPVLPDWGSGPMEAVDDFLHQNDDFFIDPEREKFLMTQNPRGYLKKK